VSYNNAAPNEKEMSGYVSGPASCPPSICADVSAYWNICCLLLTDHLLAELMKCSPLLGQPGPWLPLAPQTFSAQVSLLSVLWNGSPAAVRVTPSLPFPSEARSKF